jgi:EAL domain-containing protein (putative c-di-GMP-specific phosphodiesterase class I)/GGDEF domain-containing protein
VRVVSPVARTLTDEVAAALGAETVSGAEIEAGDIVIAEISDGAALERCLPEVHDRNGVVVVLLAPDARISADALARTDEWLLLPSSTREIMDRIASARERAAGRTSPRSSAADLVRYRELLFDRRTGLPTLPAMMERARELLDRRGEMTVLYIHFVWYEKVEEIYGWQKLDEVLETTASAVQRFYGEADAAESMVMVSHVADDDFILFTHTPASAERAERELRAVSQRLEAHLRSAIESVHGEDIATLCGIYVGAATIFRNAKMRTERMLYRGIREASHAARGAEQWERARKVKDLRATIREGAVFIEYHPIIVTETEEIFGFEALARGTRRELRSPEVLFEVAEEGNLVWELSRLLRTRAIQGIQDRLKPGQCLFLNVDPHDFDDPAFRNMSAADLGIDDPSRVVLEITERTAIRDYPRFREYIAAFRERGFRFAVDDAGSGYAGLGSIANLAPDFIKLDISLISYIDANFLKQNLVETMVAFAEKQGAKVIAEGVERQEEFETIKSLGVHYTQGFLFHKLRYTGPPDRSGTPVSHAGARRDEKES